MNFLHEKFVMSRMAFTVCLYMNVFFDYCKLKNPPTTPSIHMFDVGAMFAGLGCLILNLFKQIIHLPQWSAVESF